MAHHIYQTEALVLGSSPAGEANTQLDIFTRELGLIRARAQALRKLQSKLRYSLQEYSLAKVSFVRGKEVWRLTNAALITDFFHECADKEKKMILARITLLLRRLLNGEEQNEELFDIVKSGLYFLYEYNHDPYFKDFEYIFVIRILNSLGYWGNHEDFKKFAEGVEWTDELFADMAMRHAKVVLLINAAIKESQL